MNSMQRRNCCPSREVERHSLLLRDRRLHQRSSAQSGATMDGPRFDGDNIHLASFLWENSALTNSVPQAVSSGPKAAELTKLHGETKRLAAGLRQASDAERRSLQEAPLSSHGRQEPHSCPINSSEQLILKDFWRPVGESNPCYQRERLVS